VGNGPSRRREELIGQPIELLWPPNVRARYRVGSGLAGRVGYAQLLNDAPEVLEPDSEGAEGDAGPAVLSRRVAPASDDAQAHAASLG